MKDKSKAFDRAIVDLIEMQVPIDEFIFKLIGTLAVTPEVTTPDDRDSVVDALVSCIQEAKHLPEEDPTRTFPEGLAMIVDILQRALDRSRALDAQTRN